VCDKSGCKASGGYNTVEAIAMGGGRRRVWSIVTLGILFIGGPPGPPIVAPSTVQSPL
jgi:hypothetical protein